MESSEVCRIGRGNTEINTSKNSYVVAVVLLRVKCTKQQQLISPIINQLFTDSQKYRKVWI